MSATVKIALWIATLMAMTVATLLVLPFWTAWMIYRWCRGK
jgi:hypothetical protein